MKRVSIIFFQAIVVLIGIGALVLMLWEPHLEGRNVNATLFEIYFKDPFLAYAYASSIPFFVSLFQAHKVLGRIGRNETFTRATATALRTIQRCAVATACLVMGAEAYIVLTVWGKDDVAGGVAVGLVMMFVSVAVAAVAGVFERVVRGAVSAN